MTTDTTNSTLHESIKLSLATIKQCINTATLQHTDIVYHSSVTNVLQLLTSDLLQQLITQTNTIAEPKHNDDMDNFNDTVQQYTLGLKHYNTVLQQHNMNDIIELTSCLQSNEDSSDKSLLKQQRMEKKNKLKHMTVEQQAEAVRKQQELFERSKAKMHRTT